MISSEQKLCKNGLPCPISCTVFVPNIMYQLAQQHSPDTIHIQFIFEIFYIFAPITVTKHAETAT